MSRRNGKRSLIFLTGMTRTIVLWTLLGGIFLHQISLVTALTNTIPKAYHLTYQVSRGGYVELALNGYDPDGDALTARVTSLPKDGTLYQLTQVYNDYGYQPAYSANTRISGSQTVVTGKERRLVYVPPAKSTPKMGTWSEFTYVIEDGKGGVSKEATVYVVSSTSGKVLVGSDFSRDTEGWKVVENGKKSKLTHERTSHGRLLNHFIHSTDDSLRIQNHNPHTHTRTLYTKGDDMNRWYFQAPTKFTGNYAHAYGGVFEFTLGAFAGNFGSTKNFNSNRDVVVLECKKCNLGRGLKFAVRDLKFNGRSTTFKVTLSEKGGWVKDPRNTLKTWAAPSKCEMIDMLSNLSKISILGDHTRWYESVGLDSVKLSAGKLGGRGAVPVQCMK